VFVPLAGWPRLGMQVGLAALGMVGALDYLNPSMQDWLGAPALERAGWLGGLIVGGATTYLLLLLFLGLRPRELLSRR
jgi:putative peptidoglycan lipid II flippase